MPLLHACLWTNVGSFSSSDWAGSWENFLSLHAKNENRMEVNVKKNRSNKNFKTIIPSKNYDRSKTTRECEIF